MTLKASAENGSSTAGGRRRARSVGGAARLLLELGGNLDDLELLPEVVLVDDAAHLDEIDDAAVMLLLADRELDGHGMGAEPVDHGLHGREEVRAGAVHLVDEGDPR